MRMLGQLRAGLAYQHPARHSEVNDPLRTWTWGLDAPARFRGGRHTVALQVEHDVLAHPAYLVDARVLQRGGDFRRPRLHGLWF